LECLDLLFLNISYNIPFDPLITSPPILSLFYIAPLYVVVSFSLLCLALVGYRLAIFPTAPGASEELETDILEAKQNLIQLGFQFKAFSG